MVVVDSDVLGAAWPCMVTGDVLRESLAAMTVSECDAAGARGASL
jgi:hypothetical protein